VDHTALRSQGSAKNRFGHCGAVLTVDITEAKYIERWPSTTSTWAGWSGFDIPVNIIMEYILCYSSPAVHWSLLNISRLASREIPMEQNIKIRTVPAL
jgi:hypothetical protein